MRVVAGKRPALCGPNYEKLPAVFAGKRRRQDHWTGSQGNGLGIGVNQAGRRESPDLLIRLEYEVLAVRRPFAAAFVGRIVPASKQAMQICARRGDFPLELLAEISGALGGIEA